MMATDKKYIYERVEFNSIGEMIGWCIDNKQSIYSKYGCVLFSMQDVGGPYVDSNFNRHRYFCASHPNHFDINKIDLTKAHRRIEIRRHSDYVNGCCACSCKVGWRER